MRWCVLFSMFVTLSFSNLIICWSLFSFDVKYGSCCSISASSMSKDICWRARAIDLVQFPADSKRTRFIEIDLIGCPKFWWGSDTPLTSNLVNQTVTIDFLSCTTRNGWFSTIIYRCNKHRRRDFLLDPLDLHRNSRKWFSTVTKTNCGFQSHRKFTLSKRKAVLLVDRCQ